MRPTVGTDHDSHLVMVNLWTVIGTNQGVYAQDMTARRVMTKQEEIREGMALRLHTHDRALLRVVYEESSINCGWDKLPDYWKNRYLSDAKDFMEYFHSEGVVIKVYEYQDGYVVVEPLIEVE